ncbi:MULTISPECIES: FecR family protein [Sphingobacterium]|uniref:FecR domain-containing protein n=1 Tax=Sphingobacterium hotanense TaxID=649196 RepID=A0ABT7NHZ5_9SPHI|nr:MULTISPECIES: FecR family protein [Sphingobacterium]MDM1046817.1 FecR domain-containing protein [Sphingobacterium hotanense]
MNDTNKERINILLNRYINDKLSKLEFDELMHLVDACDDEPFRDSVREIIDRNTAELPREFVDNRISTVHANLRKLIVQDIQEQEEARVRRIKPLWYWAAAASLVLVGLFTYQRFQQTPVPELAQTAPLDDIEPGSNKASIIIDGQEHILKDGEQGLIIGDTSISYKDGDVALAGIQTNKTIRIVTPYGGQYNLVLSDGSKVWLNAGSEISYQTDFARENRTIDLKGEAYFEVQKNKNLPFIVRSREQEIRVLGTEFNINAYSDEKIIKTTLKGGSLRVRANKQQTVLKPNQQAQFNTGSNALATKSVDADAAIAWKEGIIDLHGMSLQECMRNISRWYDVEIVYQNDIPSIEMGGRMSRGLKLSTFQKFLENNFSIHTKLTSDRKLTVAYANNK